MKRLLFALLIVFSISSCGITNEDGAEPRDESVIVGNWELINQNVAEYIGEQANQKSLFSVSQTDTIEIKSPKNHHMELRHSPDMIDSYFEFELIDSTLSESDTEGENGLGTKIEFDNPKSGNGYGFAQNGSSISYGMDRFKGVWSMSFNCDTDFNKSAPKMMITFYRKDGETPYRVYIVHVNGFIDAVNRLLCE